MVLTKKQLDRIICGAYQSAEEEGYIAYCRFSEAQMHDHSKNEHFKVRSHHTAGMYASLRTDATELSFAYKNDYIVKAGSIEICVDGVLYEIFRLADRPEGTFTCTLPEGMKHVAVYFPNYSRLILREFTLNGKYTSVRNRTKVLWFGDSITQGATTQDTDSMMGSASYMALTSRVMRYDAINQAIGGIRYAGSYVLPLDGFAPDKIIVSLGTNGCTAEDFNACAEAFFTALHKAYPGVPTLVINPLWRKDDGRLQIPKNNEAVISMCKPYPNIRFVDGFTLIPHVLEFFREDGLHPNVLGHKYYSDALVREIRRLRF